MMIVPPTGSPSTIEMRAGRQENEDKGIGEKAEETDQSGEARLSHQAVRAMETQSLFRLGGSQPGWSCLEQVKQVLAGAYPRSGPASCPVSSCAAFPLNSTCRLGPALPHTQIGAASA